MTRDVEAALLIAAAFLLSFAVGFAAWADELPALLVVAVAVTALACAGALARRRLRRARRTVASPAAE